MMKRKRSPQHKTTLWQKVGLIIGSIVVCIFLLEMVLRLAGFLYLSVQENRNKASLDKKGAYRILCLGESTTALGGENSYTSQLDKILNQRSERIKFSVVNKGIGGTNTHAIIGKLEDYVKTYQPDMVIAMMGINDEGQFTYYKDIPDIKVNPFISSLRIFKLARLIWQHTVVNLNDLGFVNAKEELNLKELNVKETFITSGKEMLEQQSELNQEDAKTLFELAVAHFNEGEFSQTDEISKKILDLNPEDCEDYHYLGIANMYFNKLDQAEESFKKAIELCEYGASYITLVEIYNQTGAAKQAKEVFNKIKAANPSLAAVYYDASLNLLQSELPQVLDAFKNALESDEQNRAYGALAATYHQMGQYDLAKQYYKKADQKRLEGVNSGTRRNYRVLKKYLDKKNIKLVAVQYPVRSVKSLKKILEGEEGIVFVDNEEIFKEALERDGYDALFTDIFAGDFGHKTAKGNRLLAENIADSILDYLGHTL